MANVLLTTRCNLHCAYCFAQERLQQSGNQVMSMEGVATVIAFLKRSSHPVFRVMGGEPTLHPDFPAIVETALTEGMRVDLLSNATWPGAYNDFFNRITPGSVCFLLNIDHPANYPEPLWRRIQRNVASAAAGGNVTLSFNIFDTEPRYQYIFDLIETHHIDKIRLSLSLPVVGARNACLSLDDCRKMGPFIVDFVRRAEDLGAQVHADNAIPLCAFNHEQAGELLMKGVLDLNRNARCEPIVDIGPDLRVWCCFCLSKLWNRRLEEFEDLQQIVDYYRGIMGRYQARLYPMEECGPCQYRKLWGCQGGCLSYTVLKYGDSVDDGVQGDGWQPDAVLALHPDTEVRRYDIPEESYVVSRSGSDIRMTLKPAFQPLVTLLDGTCSGQRVVDGFLMANPDTGLQGPVAEFAGKALAEGAKGLLLGMLHAGLIVRRDAANS